MATHTEIAWIAVLTLDQHILGCPKKGVFGIKASIQKANPSSAVWSDALRIIEDVRSLMKKLAVIDITLSSATIATLDLVKGCARDLMKTINSTHGMKGNSEPVENQFAIMNVENLERTYTSIKEQIRNAVPGFMERYCDFVT